MLRQGLALLTVILGLCSLPPNSWADVGSKIDACPWETDWIPQPMPLDGGHSAIYASGSVGDTSIRAIVDTGASATTIDKELAERAGFKLGEKGRYSAIGGSLEFTKLGPIDLTLAGSALHSEKADAVSFAALKRSTSLPFDLLVGMDVLRRCAIEIDADRSRVRIGTPPLRPVGAIRIPITYSASSGLPYVPVSVGSNPQVFANLDTGSQLELDLDELLWPRMGSRGTRETSAAALGLGGEVIERLVFLPHLSIGAMRLDNVETRFSGHPLHPKSGTVGIGLLARFNSIIDLRSGVLWLSPRETPVAPRIKSTSGIQVEAEQNHSLRVAHVMLNSPAAAIGLRAGDRICSVDGQPIPDDDWRSPVRLWQRDKPGRVVKLTLCDGREKSLTLQDFY